MPDATMRINVQADSSRVTKLNKAIFNLHRQLQQATKHGKPLTAEHKRLQKMVLLVEKALVREGRAVDTLAIDYKRLNAVSRHTIKVQQNIAASSLVAGKSLGRQNAAISNASFALQDFITVMQGGGGFERAVLSTTNNIGFMAAMLSNSLKGAIIGVGVAIGAAFIPMIIKMGKTWLGQKEMVGEFADFTIKKIEEVNSAGEKLLQNAPLAPGLDTWERNLAGIDAALEHNKKKWEDWENQSKFTDAKDIIKSIASVGAAFAAPGTGLIALYKNFGVVSKNAAAAFSVSWDGLMKVIGKYEAQEVERAPMEAARQTAAAVVTKKRIDDIEDYTESVRHGEFELKRIEARREYESKVKQIKILREDAKTLADKKLHTTMMLQVQQRYNADLLIIQQEEIDAQEDVADALTDNWDELQAKHKEFVDDQKELNDKLVSDLRTLEAELLDITQTDEERQKREIRNQIQSIKDRAAAVDMKGPLLVAALKALQDKLDAVGKPKPKGAAAGGAGVPDAPPAEPDRSRGAALDALRTRQEETGPMSRSDRRKHLAYWKKHGTLAPDSVMRGDLGPTGGDPRSKAGPPADFFDRSEAGGRFAVPEGPLSRAVDDMFPDGGLAGLAASRKRAASGSLGRKTKSGGAVFYQSPGAGRMDRDLRKESGYREGYKWAPLPVPKPESTTDFGVDGARREDVTGGGLQGLLDAVKTMSQTQANNNQAISNLHNEVSNIKQGVDNDNKVSKNLVRKTKKARTR